MKKMKTLLIAAISVYLALCAFMYFAQRSLMYFPDRMRTAPADAGLPEAKEEKLATADGETIIVWHIPPRDETKPVVVYFHGNGGALNLRAQRFARLALEGIGVVGVSYRGYGGSTGSPTEDGLIADGVAAYEFAAKLYSPARVAFWGESLGTGIAIAVAAEAPVAKLVLETPFTSAADVGAAVYFFLPVRLLMKDQFRSDLRIRNVKAPVLVLHGERDSVVPIAFGERLFEMIAGEKKFIRIKGGEHYDLDRHGGLKAAIEFLAGKN
ncbi:MAG: alpha/beta hydrolase [Xanthobacteraceae bacterium]|nr:alpha/beta hydrolase [Xanthobacteraceae bacterium]